MAAWQRCRLLHALPLEPLQLQLLLLLLLLLPPCQLVVVAPGVPAGPLPPLLQQARRSEAPPKLAG